MQENRQLKSARKFQLRNEEVLLTLRVAAGDKEIEPDLAQRDRRAHSRQLVFKPFGEIIQCGFFERTDI